MCVSVPRKLSTLNFSINCWTWILSHFITTSPRTLTQAKMIGHYLFAIFFSLFVLTHTEAQRGKFELYCNHLRFFKNLPSLIKSHKETLHTEDVSYTQICQIIRQFQQDSTMDMSQSSILWNVPRDLHTRTTQITNSLRWFQVNCEISRLRLPNELNKSLVHRPNSNKLFDSIVGWNKCWLYLTISTLQQHHKYLISFFELSNNGAEN